MNQLVHGLPLGFVYDGEILAPDGRLVETFSDTNLIPQLGLTHIAQLIRGNTALIGNWYLFLFEGNYVPVSGVLPSDLPATVLECQAYSEATRPAWDHAFDGASVIDNAASRAVYHFPTQKTIYGAGIISTAAKGGNTGTILSMARFASPKTIDAGGQFTLAAGLTLIPTNVL